MMDSENGQNNGNSEEESLRFICGADERGLRLDKLLSEKSGLPRARVQRAIQQGRCLLDGKTCSNSATKLKAGQEISFSPDVEHESPQAEQGEIELIYSDRHLVVLNKPSGLTVHPCPSCPEGTLVNRLLAHFPQIAGQTGLRPGIVHRLDKDTSGLMVVALDDDTRLALSADFAERSVSKTYLALCRGLPPSTGQSKQPLGRHPTLKTKVAVVPESKGGKPAFSEWRSLYQDPAQRFALLAVDIHTGRTHQIRVHLAEAGHPLWGDKLYAPRDPSDPAPRQMLHAWRLEFTHPASGERMTFTQPPPPDFLQSALALSRRCQRLILTGSPGCGKSAALELLGKKGLPVWSADRCVAELYKPGADGWHLLRARYGERFISDAGQEVDKAALTRALLDDPGLRPELENMIHPLVYGALEDFFAQAESEGRELAAAEVPLWFESRKKSEEAKKTPGLLVASVACPAPVRYQRLEETRAWSKEKIAGIEAWQWPEEAKIKHSDFVLDNSGDLAQLERETEKLLHKLSDLRTGAGQALAEKLEALWTQPEKN